MKIARIVLAFALAAFGSSAAIAQAVKSFGFPVIRTYGADQVGAEAQFACAQQAANGIIYFGGRSLVAFDGDRWTAYPAQGVDDVTAIDITRDNRIWVGTNGDAGWYEQTSNASWKYHSLGGFVPAGDSIRGYVNTIRSHGDGVMFAVSGRGYTWDGRYLKSWAAPGLDGWGFKVNADLWMNLYGLPITRLTPRGPEVVPNLDFGLKEPAMLLWIDSDGKDWLVGTLDKIFHSENGTIHAFPANTTSILTTARVLSVTSLIDGRFVFCTGKQGIVITSREGALETAIGPDDGLSAYVHRILVDREGELWALSSTGAQQINLDPNTRIFDARAGLPPNPYPYVGVTPRGVALGNAQGVWILSPDKTHFVAVPNAPSLVQDVESSGSGLLMAAAQGVWLYQHDQAQRIALFRRNASLARPSRIHDDEILVAEHGLTIAALSGGSQRTIVKNLPAVPVSLAEDETGRLWFGTDTKGVFFADRRSDRAVEPQLVGEGMGLPDVVGESRVAATRNGDIIVAAANGGWIKPAGSNRFAPIRDYPQRPVVAISTELPDGTFWVAHAGSESTAGCVAQLSPEGGWHWTPHSIPDLDVIGPLRGLAAEFDENRRPILWIGGSKAVMRHVVLHGPVAPVPGSPLLRAFARTDHGDRQAIMGTLPYNTPAIEFEFAEPEFMHRGQLRLQTRISGIDANWIPSTGDSQRELTAIRDGSYAFAVRAVAETGVVSEPTVFSFVVAPPWWRTPLAFWFEAAALLLLITGGVQWRVRSLRRRNEQLEQKVQERTEELAEASAAKTQFVANMSHDIRNPLNGIVGLTLALEDTPLDGQQRELVATLRECTTYLSSLVDDVLDFASIEAGRIEVRTAPYVPSELLNSVVTTLKAECSARGAFLTIESDPEIAPMLQGDAGRIQQILVNYVSNALKYAGGHIRLSATVSPAAPGEIEFAVSDEGQGISEADQATLFTKFSRLQGARRSHIPGTGLGLAACRLLADFMGGSVGVESELGHGARFYLRLPLVVASEPLVATDETKLPPTSVLLVEDTDYNALAAKAVLGKLGLVCDRASTGAEAITLFTEKRHHIVLLDRNLPDMDGTEVARQLREIETDGMHSVLLAVTAYCTSDDRKLCLDAGMDAFVGKPLTPDKLRKVLLGAANQMLGTGSIAAPVAVVESAAPLAEPAKIDLTLLEYLADGTEGGVGAQIERFIGELEAAHAQLLDTQQTTNLTTLADAAHRVLGHARMVGAPKLTELLIQLESAARRMDGASVDQALPAIAPEIAELTGALRRHPAAQQA